MTAMSMAPAPAPAPIPALTAIDISPADPPGVGPDVDSAGAALWLVSSDSVADGDADVETRAVGVDSGAEDVDDVLVDVGTVMY